MAALVFDGSATDVCMCAHKPNFEGVGFHCSVTPDGFVLGFELGLETFLLLALIAIKFEAV
jgi:hypothetical protein